jgi:hypothetical protein
VFGVLRVVPEWSREIDWRKREKVGLIWVFPGEIVLERRLKSPESKIREESADE